MNSKTGLSMGSLLIVGWSMNFNSNMNWANMNHLVFMDSILIMVWDLVLPWLFVKDAKLFQIAVHCI